MQYWNFLRSPEKANYHKKILDKLLIDNPRKILAHLKILILQAVSPGIWMNLNLVMPLVMWWKGLWILVKESKINIVQQVRIKYRIACRIARARLINGRWIKLMSKSIKMMMVIIIVITNKINRIKMTNQLLGLQRNFYKLRVISLTFKEDQNPHQDQERNNHQKTRGLSIKSQLHKLGSYLQPLIHHNQFLSLFSSL